MGELFRFVVVGSGNISSTYFQAVGNITGATIVGLVSRTEHRPAFVPETIPVAPVLEDLSVAYDGVILATPNGLHHQGAIEAARLGKHVLTEKPLDIKKDTIERMIVACSDNNVKLGVTFQHRMSPDNKVLKGLIAGGKLGRIYAADYTVRCWRDQAYYDSGAWRGGWEIDGGGPFMQQACHELDLYTWFFGMPDEVVSFTETFAHDIEVEDHGAALFRHRNGMIGTFIASTVAYPGLDPTLTILCEKGTLVITNGRITDWHIQGLDNPSQSKDYTAHSGAASASVSDTAGHEAIITDFVDAVANDREPTVSAASAKLGTELALRIYGKL